MTSKAEKLARELIALGERYSQRDFDRATELLMSGDLFAVTLDAARTARNSATKAKAKRSGQQRPGTTRRGAVRGTTEPTTEFEIADLFRDLDGDDRDALTTFARRFENREILESGSSARIFAQQAGIQLPKSIPSRPALLKTLIKRLRDMPRETRGSLLREAERIGSGESSLQRWSDLIVKSE